MIQLKVPSLRAPFPYVVVIFSTITVVSSILTNGVSLATIVLSFYLLVLGGIHNKSSVIIFSFITSLMGLTLNVIANNGNYYFEAENVYLIVTCMFIATNAENAGHRAAAGAEEMYSLIKQMDTFTTVFNNLSATFKS